MKKAFLLPCVLLFVQACIKSRPEEKDAGKVEAPPAQTASTTSAAFNVQQCESLLIDAERKLADERAKAPTDCKKDDDCKIIETSACVPACNDRAIAKKGEAAYTKQREILRQSSCKLWNDAECPRTTPKPQPNCAPTKAVCKANRCEAAAP